MRAMSKLIFTSSALMLGLASLPAQASWSTANVKGSYAFRLMGYDSAATKSWFVGTGIFIADGSGNITGGSITYNDGGDVCTATVNSETGAYTVASDGEGTLNLTITPTSGTCPIDPNIDFAIALATPNTKPTPIALTIEMNTVEVTINSSQKSTDVMIYGAGNLL